MSGACKCVRVQGHLELCDVCRERALAREEAAAHVHRLVDSRDAELTALKAELERVKTTLCAQLDEQIKCKELWVRKLTEENAALRAEVERLKKIEQVAQRVLDGYPVELRMGADYGVLCVALDSPAPTAPSDADLSERVAAALKRSEPLVRDAMRLGREATAIPGLIGTPAGPRGEVQSTGPAVVEQPDGRVGFTWDTGTETAVVTFDGGEIEWFYRNRNTGLIEGEDGLPLNRLFAHLREMYPSKPEPTISARTARLAVEVLEAIGPWVDRGDPDMRAVSVALSALRRELGE